MITSEDNTFIFNEQDIPKRVHGCVIRYRGEPVWCGGLIPPSGTIALYPLSQVRDKRPGMMMEPYAVKYYNPEIDYSNIQVGYANSQRACVYVFRSPHRRYKVSLHSDNASYWDLEGNQFQSGGPDFIYSEAMEKCYNNNYPSFQEAVEYIERSTRDLVGRAFARTFALLKTDDEWTLWHTFNRIGKVDPNTKNVKLEGKYANSIVEAKLMKYGVHVIC